MGRKNWLFSGSDGGARRAAILYSLIASCKLCGIDPFVYLRDVPDHGAQPGGGKRNGLCWLGVRCGSAETALRDPPGRGG
ncbi:MAG: IS66 family transposase [Planctomycetes bacterium]|nr:IS66 family transposase [Planctomycetota bacterium]